MPNYSTFSNTAGRVILVEVDLIDVDPNQPRKHFDQDELNQLRASIDAHGLHQPINVYKDGNRYRLISGERRLRCVTELGHKTVLVKIDPVPKHSRKLQLMENTARADLRPAEVLGVIEELLAGGETVGGIAGEVGMSEVMVRTYQRIALDPDLRAQLLSGMSLREVERYRKERDNPGGPIEAAPPAPETHTARAPDAGMTVGDLPSLEPVPRMPDPSESVSAVADAEGSREAPTPGRDRTTEADRSTSERGGVGSNAVWAQVVLPGAINGALKIIAEQWGALPDDAKTLVRQRLRNTIGEL